MNLHKPLINQVKVFPLGSSYSITMCCGVYLKKTFSEAAVLDRFER